jgi:hypothetical protein
LDHQCSTGAPAVSSGWYVYGVTTRATTTLSNSCGAAGVLGDSVSSGGQAGAVTEEGSLGSGVVLAVAVPGSAPDVTIQSISAHVTVSSVTGDDAFLEFAANGQSLPGAAEIIDGGAGYAANDTWTLPENAREFTTAVNCSTDHSHTTCQFATANEVPALNEITLTLTDNVPPTVEASGTLAGAAASNATVSGVQTVSVTGKDSDSGVQSTTLTLIPHAGGNPYTKTFEFACPHESWNACATQNTGEEALQTGALVDGTYTVEITANDAAGNHKTSLLGNITTHNAPQQTTAPSITASSTAVGAQITAHPGSWSEAAETGTISYSYQWEDCNTQGEGCQPIASAQNNTYTITSNDIGHTVRVTVTAANNDGYTKASSPATSLVSEEKSSLGAPNGPGSQGAPGTNGANGAAGSNGASGTAGAAGAGAPNGTIATPTASIQLGVAHVLTRPFARRQLQIPGRLLNAQSEPISGATLEVLQQTPGTPGTRLVARAQTRGDGSFTALVPPGSSRLIEIAYRAFSAAPVYAAQTTLLERVGAGVRLTIAPHSISPKGQLTLTGQVNGPIPHQGVRVEIVVYYLKHYVPLVRDVHTTSNGRFRVAYRFHGARGVFPIHAVVQGNQAGFNYATGETSSIDVRSH